MATFTFVSQSFTEELFMAGSERFVFSLPSLKLYPNPAQHFLTVELTGNSIGRISCLVRSFTG
jgi:hypothetical protein